MFIHYIIYIYLCIYQLIDINQVTSKIVFITTYLELRLLMPNSFSYLGIIVSTHSNNVSILLFAIYLLQLFIWLLEFIVQYT